MAGLLIIRIFKRFNTVFGVIVLMMTVSLAFYAMSVYDILWVFFLGHFVLGITNAGVRILKTTYLFNHVPNNLIGRTNSVFGFLNTVVRMMLIALFALPFYQIYDNIRYGYIVGVILMWLTLMPLILWYKRILNVEKN